MTDKSHTITEGWPCRHRAEAGKPLIYGSVCSGIEAATVAWEPLGWEAAWYSEIEPFPCRLLEHRHPKTPNLGDMTKLLERRETLERPIDLLVGGTPCQSFSVAGLRAGLADPRGNLALVFLKLLDRLRPRWMVWENVPGVLSSWSDEEALAASEESIVDAVRAGEALQRLAFSVGVDPGAGIGLGDITEVRQANDFDTFTGGLRELGYGLAWRVLDAQFFGVPQRRRRVFVVGYLGDARRANAVLFESDCLSGNPPPLRKAGEGIAPTISARPTGGGGLGTDFDLDGGLQVHGPKGEEVSHALTAKNSFRQDPTSETLIAHTLRGEGHDASEDGTGRGVPLVPAAKPGNPEVAGTLGANHGNIKAEDAWGDKLVFSIQERALAENPESGPDGKGIQEGTAYTLEARSRPQAVAFGLRTEASGANVTPASEERTKSLDTGSPPAVCFQQNSRSEVRDMGNRAGAVTSQPVAQCQNYVAQEPVAFTQEATPKFGNKSNTLDAQNGSRTSVLLPSMSVRRLTPRECERLQGFPDDYTLIPVRKVKRRAKNWEKNGKQYAEIKGKLWEMASDSVRYKALGNSMAVDVMAWIGRRIKTVEEITNA